MERNQSSVNRMATLLLFSDGLPLLPHLPIPIDDVLVRRQFLDSARTASVKLVGADADFRSESELSAVVEPCAGIDHHRRTVDLRRKPPGSLHILREDRFRVPVAVSVDVCYRFVKRLNNFDR